MADRDAPDSHLDWTEEGDMTCLECAGRGYPLGDADAECDSCEGSGEC